MQRLVSSTTSSVQCPRLRPVSSRHIAPVVGRQAGVHRGGCSASSATPAAAPSSDSITTTGTNDNKYNWTFPAPGSQQQQEDGRRSSSRLVKDIPVAAIRRPLAGTRANDSAKVEALMKSIQEIGLQEPIDILEVDGQYYGFSGCHRFEAHQRLGLETIRCRVRKSTKAVLKMHLS